MPLAIARGPSRLGKALLIAGFAAGLMFSRPANAGVFLSINVAPPPLPVYVQPIAPGPDFIWSPGYWAYDEDGYYWVPGTWVRAPQVGYLWTPGYWGWSEGYYVWHAGYWGPHVGFYGGINYGCGYTGSGYWGGHWDHGSFFYNTAVTRVNTTIIHNTYNTVIVNKTVQNVSFNGGQGGIAAKPTPQEAQAAQEHHLQPTALQVQHQHMASTNKAMFASVNHGAPKIAATTKPAVFTGHGIVAAKASLPHAGGDAHPPAHKSVDASHAPDHAKTVNHAANEFGTNTHASTHKSPDAFHAPGQAKTINHTANQSFAQKPHPQPKIANAHPQRPNFRPPPKIAANHPPAPHHAEGGGKPRPGKRPEHG